MWLDGDPSPKSNQSASSMGRTGSKGPPIPSGESSSSFGASTSDEALPRVRAATMADLDSLVHIEFAAYNEVYGRTLDLDLIAETRDKYFERIELLGEWVRVLEDRRHGTYGMIVCCPTNLPKEDFISEARDMTQNEALYDVRDPNGKYGYIVNLAILPRFQGWGTHFVLFEDCRQRAVANGVESVFFESRIPGFKRWLARERETREAAGLSAPKVHEAAESYWRLTVRQGELEKPKDPLLQIYADFGCVPLCLIENAWEADDASMGYGVLCEFPLSTTRL